MTWKVAPAGDSCLIVEFDDLPNAPAVSRAAAAARLLFEAGIQGVSDVVPAMRTLGVHYSPFAVLPLAQGAEIPYQTVERLVTALLAGLQNTTETVFTTVDIPVCYGGIFGPDLEESAGKCGLSSERLVELHTRSDVSVLMLGFAPGHPYIGTFDESLAVPRRSQPRTAVPAGSIGFANRQSVIYPFSLPGGWSLIGRTPLKIFDPQRSPPCLLQAGDKVNFFSISEAEFDSWKEKS